jgi:ribosome-interacting GTPase 1
MALPASEQWARIQREITGKSNSEQISIIRNYLDNWPDEWKGPYRDLKEKLTKILNKLETVESVKSSTSRSDPFHIKHEGDGQISIIGLTNSGKSAVVSTLTPARTEVTDYPFATQIPIPGMLHYSGAVIQVLDTPPIVPALSTGEGSGPQLLHLIRNSDAIGMVIDLSHNPIDQLNTILSELAMVQITPIGKPLGTLLRIKGKGGVIFSGQPISREDQVLARRILADSKIQDVEVHIRTVFSENELSSQISKRILMPSIVIANKNDLSSAKDNLVRLKEVCSDLIIVDVNFLDETNFDELKQSIFKILSLVRIYVLDKPTIDSKQTLVVMPRSSSIEEVAKRLNQSRTGNPSLARVWGQSVKFPGQSVGMEYLIHEEDRIHIQ